MNDNLPDINFEEKKEKKRGALARAAPWEKRALTPPP